MMKWRYFFIGLATLAAIAGLFLFWLITTESGLQWTAKQLEYAIPGLKLTSVNGRLNRDITIQGFRWKNETKQLQIKTIQFKWQPLDLFADTLKVNHIIVDHINWHNLSPASDSDEEKDIPLEFHLPFKLQIDHAEINQSMLQVRDEEPIRIRQILLKTNAIDSNHILLKELNINLENYQVSAQGTLQHKPLDIHLNLAANRHELALANAKLHITGTPKKFNANIDLLSPLPGKIQAKIKHPLDQFNWQLNAKLDSDDYQLPNHTKISIHTDITAKGNKQSLTASGSLTIKPIVFSELHPQRLEFQLKAHKKNYHWYFDTNSQWENLAWPLTRFPDYESPKGKLQAKGQLDNYSISLQASSAGHVTPKGTWDIDAKGSQQQLIIKKLAADTLGGKLSGNATLQWKPHVKWSLNLRGEKIDPGKHWFAWPGEIYFEAKSRGEKLKTGWQGTLTLPTLMGILRKQNLKSTLEAKWQDNYLRHIKTQSSWGEAQATIGIDSEKKLYRGNWDINIPNFTSMIPWTSGKFQSKGQISGNLKTPIIQLQLAGKKLVWNSNHIDDINASGNIAFTKTTTSHFSLHANNINYAGYQINNSSLEINSARGRQKIALAINGDYQLAINAQGSYDYPNWKGKISTLNLDLPDQTYWILKKPFDTSFAQNQILLKPFCLRTFLGKRSQSICGQWHWHKNAKSHFKLDIKNFHLQQLVKTDIAKITLNNQLNLNADFNFNPIKGLRGNLQGTISKGTLHYKSKGDKIKSYYLDQNTFQVNADESGLSANWRWPTSSAKLLHAQLSLPDYHNLYDMGSSQAIKGFLDIHLQHLNLLNLFFPQLKNTDGTLALKSRWDGSIMHPNFSADVTLAKLTADIPEYGLALRNGQLSAQGSAGKPINYQFQIDSGKGTLYGKGNFNPSIINWSGKLAIHGEWIEVMNTHDTDIIVSPTLNFEHTKEGSLLQGSILIPKAHIYYQDYDDVVTLPDETVFIGKNVSLANPWLSDLYAKLTLKLGDDVHFKTDQFTSRLGGTITLFQSPKQLTTAQGDLKIIEGHYQAYGQNLNISHGRLIYTRNPVNNPGLDIKATKSVGDMLSSSPTSTARASATSQDLTVGLDIQGSLHKPRVTLFSIPGGLDQTDILSYLVLGQPLRGVDSNNVQVLWQAANLLDLGGNNLVNISQQLRSTFGLDELTLASDDYANQTRAPQRSTSLVLGKMLSPSLFISYSVGLVRPINTFTVRYQFSKSWSVQGETNSLGQGADILYSFSIG